MPYDTWSRSFGNPLINIFYLQKIANTLQGIYQKFAQTLWHPAENFSEALSMPFDNL
jgi:hypothetical protein